MIRKFTRRLLETLRARNTHFRVAVPIALAVILAISAWPTSDAAAALDDLPFVIEPSAPRVNLAELVTVRLKVNRDDLNQGLVFEIGFAELDEDWHLVSDWTRSTGAAGSPPAGVWFAKLQCFRKGEQKIPKANLKYYSPRGNTGESTAFGQSFTVMGSLSDTIRDPRVKPLRPLQKMSIAPESYVKFAAGGCIGAALVLLGIWLWRKYRPYPEGAEQIAGRGDSPWEWAFEEIEEKRNLPAVIEGDGKLIATLASEVIRAYLGRRFDFHALEMTSLECVQHLKAGVAPGPAIAPIQKFLNTCDLIKFSTHEVDRATFNQFWDEAIRIVNMTIPQIEAEPGLNLRDEFALHGAENG